MRFICESELGGRENRSSAILVSLVVIFEDGQRRSLVSGLHFYENPHPARSRFRSGRNYRKVELDFLKGRDDVALNDKL